MLCCTLAQSCWASHDHMMPSRQSLQALSWARFCMNFYALVALRRGCSGHVNAKDTWKFCVHVLKLLTDVLSRMNTLGRCNPAVHGRTGLFESTLKLSPFLKHMVCQANPFNKHCVSKNFITCTHSSLPHLHNQGPVDPTWMLLSHGSLFSFCTNK